MDKKISIILSTYNEAPFVVQTINEILNNIKNVEIILVDDNSTDGTLEKVKKINNPNIKIYQGRALEVINKLNSTYDVVNAVGVMFHIVDDFKWQNTIYSIGKVINKGGIFIIGGHFGILNGLNVQIDNNGINKRLRSRKHWKKILKRAGFNHVKFYRNYSYLKINDTIPENNVLIATK